MALHGYDEFKEFVNDLIDGKVDGEFNTAANGEYELGVGNFNGAAFKGIESLRDQFWSDLLEYIYKENDNLGHSIVRDNDWAALTDNMETVFQYINSNADLDNGSSSTFYTKEQFNTYKTTGDLANFNTYEDYVQSQYLSYILNYIDEEDPHWNESLCALVDYYLKYFEDVDSLDDIEYTVTSTVKDSNGNINMGDNYVEFRTDDIIHGDAGNYFARADESMIKTYNGNSAVVNEDYSNSYESDIKTERDTSGSYRINKDKTWVRPWFNIDKSTYSIERGNDKIKRVLNDNRNLQFTRYKENEQDYINEKLDGKEDISATLEKYLRLIMPMYERIVEIEDLDRNFWVIAQVLGGLSAYILGDDSPIGDMFAGLADEVVQLWENILYLWVAMGLISQEPYYTDIKKLFIPVYNSEIEAYVKFDNFTEWSSDYVYTNEIDSADYCEDILRKIWEEDKNIMSLKDEYNKSNLVILPEVRQKNYFENYYAQVVYPGMIIYNRNYDETHYIVFSTQKSYDIYWWPDLTGDLILSSSVIINDYSSSAQYIDAYLALAVYATIAAGEDLTDTNFSFTDNYGEVHDFGINVFLSSIQSAMSIEGPFTFEGVTYGSFYSFLWKCIDNVNVNYFGGTSFYNNELRNIEDSDSFIETVQNDSYKGYFEQWLQFAYINVEKADSETATVSSIYLASYILRFITACNRGEYSDTISDFNDFLYAAYKLRVIPYGTIEYTTPIYIDLSNANEPITKYMYSFYEDTDYYYFSEFRSSDGLEQLYKGAIRTIANFDVSINSSYQIGINFDTFYLNFHDIARELAGNSNFLIGTVDSISSGTVFPTNTIIEYPLNFEINSSLAGISNSSVSKTLGYYQGELTSYLNASKFIIGSCEIQAITYNPQDGYTIDNSTIVSKVTLSSMDSYIDYMASSGKTSWESIVANKATSDLTTSGSSKLYYCNSGYYDTDSSSVSTFEMKPYITLAVNKNGVIYYYHFTQNVSNNGLSSLIPYPYISSVYESEGGVENESISRLCLFPNSPGTGLEYDSSNYKYTGDSEIYFVAPQSKRYYTFNSSTLSGLSLNTVGVSIYGNMDIYYKDSYFYLKNYAIMMVDRCRLSTTSAIQAVPYYYLCEVTSVPSTNKWGKITCKYQEGIPFSSSNCYGETDSKNYYTLNSNSELDTSNPVSLTIYKWEDPEWKSSEYMNNYSEVGIDGYLNYSSSSFRNNFESNVSDFDFNEYNVAGGV